MSQVIYVDVLLLLNLVVNYLLLVSTAVMAGLKKNSIRLAASSFLGSLYSLVVFFPNIKVLYAVFLRAVFSISMVLLAFKSNNIKSFLRAYASFLLINFLFAGLMLAIWITFKPNGMVYQNGAVYFDINALTLTLTAIFCYMVSLVISYFIKRRAPDSHIIYLNITNKNKTISVKALLDTGNTLKEPFSSYPVVICEYNLIKDIIPNSIEALINKPIQTDYSSNDNIRFVSFTSVGGSGLLPSFRPQKVELIKEREKLNTDEVYIAVYNKSLSNGEYNALIGNLLLEVSTKGESCHKKSYKINTKSNT